MLRGNLSNAPPPEVWVEAEALVTWMQGRRRWWAPWLRHRPYPKLTAIGHRWLRGVTGSVRIVAIWYGRFVPEHASSIGLASEHRSFPSRIAALTEVRRDPVVIELLVSDPGGVVPPASILWTGDWTRYGGQVGHR